jgi:hypothetical protein
MTARHSTIQFANTVPEVIKKGDGSVVIKQNTYALAVMHSSYRLG